MGLNAGNSSIIKTFALATALAALMAAPAQAQVRC